MSSVAVLCQDVVVLFHDVVVSYASSFVSALSAAASSRRARRRLAAWFSRSGAWSPPAVDRRRQAMQPSSHGAEPESPPRTPEEIEQRIHGVFPELEGFPLWTAAAELELLTAAHRAARRRSRPPSPLNSPRSDLAAVAVPASSRAADLPMLSDPEVVAVLETPRDAASLEEVVSQFRDVLETPLPPLDTPSPSSDVVEVEIRAPNPPLDGLGHTGCSPARVVMGHHGVAQPEVEQTARHASRAGPPVLPVPPQRMASRLARLQLRRQISVRDFGTYGPAREGEQWVTTVGLEFLALERPLTLHISVTASTASGLLVASRTVELPSTPQGETTVVGSYAASAAAGSPPRERSRSRHP